MKLLDKWPARVGVGLMILLLVFALATLEQCQSAKSARTQATLDANQGSAAIQSGSDAVDTVGNHMALEAHFDDITEENDNAIRNAPGADAPVDPAVRDAGLSGLCQRAAYRGNPKCVRFTPAR